jgi:putative tryptophan/tyrosine transport system substrate-binding protein
MPFDQLKRRQFIALLGGASAFGPTFVRAQQSPRPLIAVLEAGSAASVAARHDAFRAGLRQLGYVEGYNIGFEYRFADGFIDRLSDLAAELVRLNPTVIVSAPMPANVAVRKVTSTIPIVMATGADPVGFGLVQSLSHPGGNVTGLTNFAEVLASKQLDIIREMIPRLMRIGALVNVENPLHVPQWRETQAAAAKAGLALVRFDYHVPEDLERAFDQFAREKVEALLVPPDVAFGLYRVRIVELAAKARLPAIYYSRASTQAGGLLSYGPDQTENYGRAAVFVDKILKGAKPADLPIERPTKIELVINLKTAKVLGLDVPPTLLARADEVIE